MPSLFLQPWRPWLVGLTGCSLLADEQRRPLRLLLLLWAVIVVLFFSLRQSKLLGYSLLAVPPLAALIADSLSTETPGRTTVDAVGSPVWFR